MEIKRLSIKNWQGIGYLNIEFQKMLILIGESNRGKTSILKGLAAILGGYEIKDSDFKDKKSEIEIKIKYYDKNSGFLTLKLVKKIGEKDSYFVLDHGVERE